MPFDEELASRLRRVTDGLPGVTEKRMFGGIAFLRHGRMFAGVFKEDLMARVGPSRYDDFLEEPHARPMDFTKRPMKGYLYIEPAGTQTETDVRHWVKRTLEFVATLPEDNQPQTKKAATRRRR